MRALGTMTGASNHRKVLYYAQCHIFLILVLPLASYITMADEAWVPPVDRQEARARMHYWGMPQSEYTLSEAWYRKCFCHSFFGSAFVLPLSLSGVEGLVVAVSSRESNRIQQWYK